MIVLLIKPIFPVIDYVTNYDYISKVLCENKDKPKMHCNGKCQLMKELAKASENEKPISNDKKGSTQVQEILFFQELMTFKVKAICIQGDSQLAISYSDFYTFLNSDSYFRPPILIS